MIHTSNGLSRCLQNIQPNTKEQIFYSAHGSLSKVAHILGHKTNIYKFRKIEKILHILSDHNAKKKKKPLKKKASKALIILQTHGELETHYWSKKKSRKKIFKKF